MSTDTKLMQEMFTTMVNTMKAKVSDPECPASVLKEVREFLKDQGVRASDENADVKGLANDVASLPFAHEGDG